MSAPILSQNKSDALALGALIVGLSILAIYNIWWPWILLIIGLATIVRQYLRGRHYDMYVSVVVFGGLFLFYFFNINWAVLMPVIFTTGAIYIVFREFFTTGSRSGYEQLEDARKEIEDERENH